MINIVLRTRITPEVILNLRQQKTFAWTIRGCHTPEGAHLSSLRNCSRFLPLNYEYRIILMERPLDEVLASQKAMLDRHSRKGAALSSEKLRTVYEEQLLRVIEVLETRKLPVLRVSHHGAIRNPVDSAKCVVDFLNLPLDRAAMALAIDPSLHRQRLGT